MSLSTLQRTLVGVAITVSMVGCEPPMKAKLEGGNPPNFAVWSGTGKLWHISVSEYVEDRSLKPSERSRELWRVNADTHASASYASTIGTITYGTVPRGYRQAVPTSGPPPVLISGKQYSYWIGSENGMPATGDFEIRNGVAVAAEWNHGCYYVKDGKEIETPCDDGNDNSNR